MKAKLASLLCLLALALPVRAEVVAGVFGGTFNYACDVAAMEPVCAGLDLGVQVGDRFAGSFGYELDTGAPLYLAAAFAGQSFVASDLQFLTGSDSHISFVSLSGQLSNGLFIALGLTNPGAMFESTLPAAPYDEFDWVMKSFSITPFRISAVESECCISESIRGSYFDKDPAASNSTEFFIRTRLIPEPAPWSLVAIAMLLIVARSRTRRAGA